MSRAPRRRGATRRRSPTGSSRLDRLDRKQGVPVLLWVVLGIVLVAAAIGGLFLWRGHLQSTGGFPAPSGWIEHRPADAGYSVRLPKVPTRSRETRTIGNAELDMVMYLVENDRAVCGVAHCEIPPPHDQDDPQAMLDRSALGVATGVFGRTYWEERLTVDGHPARDLAILTSRGGTQLHLRVRIVVANGRLHLVQGLQQGGFGDWTEDLVKSLRILP